jgi:hypothetical protein
MDIPGSVNFIDRSAVVQSSIGAILVDPENRHFVVDGCLLLDTADSVVVRYSSRVSDVLIEAEIRGLRKCCFWDANINKVTFVSVSQFGQIEELCFGHCPLQSICIPSWVEVVYKTCFAGGALTR